MGQVFGVLAGAALSAAFMLPKPWCYIAAIATASLVSLARSI